MQTKCKEGKILKEISFANGDLHLVAVKTGDRYYCYLSLRDKICHITESTNMDDLKKHFVFFFKSLSKTKSTR
jgi:hypothetical protein